MTYALDARPRQAAEQAPGAAEKALLLLESLTALSAAGVPPTLTGLATASGLAKSTTHRLLSLLVRRGMVTCTDGAYRPGPALAGLAAAALGLPVDRLRSTLLPHMVDLYELTHETVNLAVLQGPDIVLIERVHGSRTQRSSVRLPERVPAHSTALGRALLDAAGTSATAPPHAGVPGDRTGVLLSEIRRQGMSTSLGELIPGVACLALPILDEARNPVMALSVSGWAQSMNLLSTAKHLRSVSLAAGLALLTEED
ncbi:Acetate operon repressor [Streptomyces sp. ADI96-02]|uniref:IclR family transcriptional regulator n=1 Tax=Streptomyces sp. ADI96-02 TaxID=1522760 RepID=UPI000F54D832|nr:IclR family transcriptional regulator C-terminal domain-containing protein [Streptomyces sp. ADI96-02]RPK55082.1 Acetate operon repressor [Streptomyces sp. ADI96-02]